MRKVVTKFGGSSLADANQIKKACDIILANSERQYVVVSASGKRNGSDDKITDLLISYHNAKDDKKKCEEIFSKLKERYLDIVKNLNIDFDIEKELKEIFEEEKAKEKADFLASRGEYLSAKIVSKYLKAEFLDTRNVIIFNDNGKLDYDLTYKNLSESIKRIMDESCECKDGVKTKETKHVVIPGFYGSTKNGEIVTFSRGGSDITGSLVASAIGADIYENWTDVSGVMFADPRIASDVKPIEYITYTELRELSYMGASVLHQEAVYPVSSAGIPINILNTNIPSDKGTMIMSNIPTIVKRKTVTGVAGRKGFTAILLQKALMNEEVGYMSKLLQIFEKENIPIEHCPTGIDTISVVLRTELFDGKKDLILKNIRDELKPDVLNVEDNISIIAVVGDGMVYNKSVIMEIFKALCDASVSVRMIDQGSSGINVIIGVSNDDYEKSIRALSSLQNI